MINRVTISQTAISRALDFISSIGLEHRAVKSSAGRSSRTSAYAKAF